MMGNSRTRENHAKKLLRMFCSFQLLEFSIIIVYLIIIFKQFQGGIYSVQKLIQCIECIGCKLNFGVSCPLKRALFCCLSYRMLT